MYFQGKDSQASVYAKVAGARHKSIRFRGGQHQRHQKSKHFFGQCSERWQHTEKEYLKNSWR